MQPDYRTQQQRILGLLKLFQALSDDDGWCPLPEILDLRIAKYSSRITELRKQGFVIENRSERKGRARHTWFRLVKEPHKTA